MASSVADELRRAVQERTRALSTDERIALALALGDDDVALYMAAHGVDETTARTVLARTRRRGRTPSRSAWIAE